MASDPPRCVDLRLHGRGDESEFLGEEGGCSLKLFDTNGVERAELSVVDDWGAKLRLGRSVGDLWYDGLPTADFEARAAREPHVTLFARPASYVGRPAESFDRAAQVVVGTHVDGVELVRKVDGRTSIIAKSPAGRDGERPGHAVRIELDPQGGVSTTLDSGAGRLVLTAPESRPTGAKSTCVEATDVDGAAIAVWPPR